MNSPRNVYTVKVSLFYSKRIYLEIEIPGNHTLAHLHETIFRAFDRFDEHLYAFYMTRKKMTNIRRMYDYPQYVHPIALEPDRFQLFEKRAKEYSAKKVTLNELKLSSGTVFYYLFDFGDCWWHEITVKKIEPEKEGVKYPRIVKAVGEAPPQYPDMVEE